jgi:hypothetical protein
MAACPHYSPAGCRGTDDGPLLRELATLRAEIEQLRRERDAIRNETLEELQSLYRGYVNALESGRDRILFFGGTCDPVDVMEQSDPKLVRARSAIRNLKEPSAILRAKEDSA